MSIHKKIFSALSVSLITVNLGISSNGYSKTVFKLPELIVENENDKDQKKNKTDSDSKDKVITDKQVLMNSLKEDIRKNSQFFQTNKLYTYKNKNNKLTNEPFKTKDEIIENVLFKENPIETFRTTISPLSLGAVQDTEFGLLDEHLVKNGFDIKDYVKVYRTQGGQFFIVNDKDGSKYEPPEGMQDPEEIKDFSTRRFALDGYLNITQSRSKYSYTGKENDWYDTDSLAEKAYKEKIYKEASSSGRIKKTLFYHYGNSVYNAFSKEDTEKLKTKLESGIHFDSYEDKKTAEYSKFPSYAAETEKFWDNFKERLFSIFDDNIEHIVEYKTNVKGNFKITSGNDDDVETILKNVKNNFPNDIKISNQTKKGFDVNISDALRGEFDEEKFTNFKDITEWNTKEGESQGCRTPLVADTKNFKYITLQLKKAYSGNSYCLRSWWRPDPIKSSELSVNFGEVTNKKIKLSRKKIGNKTWDGLVKTFSNFLSKTEDGEEFTIDYDKIAEKAAGSDKKRQK